MFPNLLTSKTRIHTFFIKPEQWITLTMITCRYSGYTRTAPGSAYTNQCAGVGFWGPGEMSSEATEGESPWQGGII